MSLSLWNFTIDDTSPFLTYTPYADGSNSGLDKGWEPWYTVTGFLTTNGDPGSGTAVYLYGTTNSSYDTALDNKPVDHDPPSSDLLFSVSDLAEGTHSVTLTAQPTSSSQQLAFDRAVISIPLVENQTPTELFYDNTDRTMLQYSGTWASSNAPGIPNASVSAPWQETFVSGASVQAEIGPGAVGVAFYGMANWGNWLYSAGVDGASNTYNGSTFWQVPDALLFYQGGLDPNTTHKITLTDASNQKLALNSMRVFNVTLAQATAVAPGSSASIHSPSPSSSSSNASATSTHRSVSAGVIVGPIIGVLVHEQQIYGSASARFDRLYSWFDWLPYPQWIHTGLTSPGATSMHSVSTTQVYGPPGATVMTWGPGAVPNADGDAAGSHLGHSTVYSPSYDHHDTATVARSSSYAPSSDGTASDAAERQHRPVPAGKMRTPPPPPPPAAPAGLDTPDVDRLIELIAQRIDRRGQDPNETAPPQYHG
ncbi:hypothetical protein K438DRAFT_1964655 [Mycena galopus ATCC 62051]|nr:hypothetical protein K438DRAFT_1964655 [Mycena galopus ATCC 62051]